MTVVTLAAHVDVIGAQARGEPRRNAAACAHRQIGPMRVRTGTMTATKSQPDRWMWLWPRLERRGQPLAPRMLFARRLATNVGLALALILLSLLAGMAGYHYLEGAGWLDAFDQTAMIVGGMGPYSEPKTDGGKLFAGLFALYSGLLLIGVTVFILTPLFHRVMHAFHLPDQDDTAGAAAKAPSRSRKSRARKP